MKYDDLAEPYMGRIIVEAIHEDLTEFLAEKSNLDKESHLAKSGFEIVPAKVKLGNEGENAGEFEIENLKVPLKKGKIIKMAVDACGECFQRMHGPGIPKLDLNDIVWFIPMQTYKIDPGGKYHLIADESVLMYKRG